MPGLNLKTSAIKGVVKSTPVAQPDQEARGRSRSLSPSLLAGAIKKPQDSSADVKKSALFLSQELADARSEISEVHSAVIEVGKRLQSSVDAHLTSLHERLKQASKKVTLVFDVKRDSEGRITSVISRPES